MLRSSLRNRLFLKRSCRNTRLYCSELPAGVVSAEDQSKKLNFHGDYIPKNTPLKDLCKTNPCYDLFPPVLSDEVEKLLTEVKWPKGWAESQFHVPLAEKISNPEPMCWDMRECFRYIANEMPISYNIIRRVFTEIQKLHPNLKPKSLLDFGTGPGTAIWAAESIFGESLRSVRAVEVNPKMKKIAQRLTKDCNLPVTWSDSIEMDHIVGIKLSVCAFALGEMDEGERIRALDSLWKATKDTLVLVEGGSKKCSDIIRNSRDYILQKHPQNQRRSDSAFVLAPCTHEGECPMTNSKSFCNFGTRVPMQGLPKQSGLAQPKKGGQDHVIHFSYVVLRKGISPRIKGKRNISTEILEQAENPLKFAHGFHRIVSPPSKSTKQVSLKLCNSNGDLETRVIQKKFDKYRIARRSKWGDLWAFNEDADI